MKKKKWNKNVYVFTDLALGTGVPQRANTLEAVDQVDALATVRARATRALVHVHFAPMTYNRHMT